MLKHLIISIFLIETGLIHCQIIGECNYSLIYSDENNNFSYDSLTVQQVLQYNKYSVYSLQFTDCNDSNLVEINYLGDFKNLSGEEYMFIEYKKFGNQISIDSVPIKHRILVYDWKQLLTGYYVLDSQWIEVFKIIEG